MTGRPRLAIRLTDTFARSSPVARTPVWTLRWRLGSFRRHQPLDGLHHRKLWIGDAEIAQFRDLAREVLRVEHRVAPFPVVIAAQPEGDVLRIGDLVARP